MRQQRQTKEMTETDKEDGEDRQRKRQTTQAKETDNEIIRDRQ